LLKCDPVPPVGEHGDGFDIFVGVEVGFTWVISENVSGGVFTGM
jgi:hypothetical protein